MFNRGKEISVHVSGGDDGAFDSGDYIEFFGAGISRSDLSFVYTETNVYWLLFTKGDGLRMVKKDGTPSGSASVPGSFYRTLHMEQDTNYWQSLPQGKGQDHWFWGSTIYKGKKIIGEATTQALLQARTSGMTQDTLSGYLLFGDPATKLKAVH